ncbi:hypothetical protein CAFE_18160 [Caprobacter fermentans]|uniref:Uncharacterized protein n=1 Tax=Caproicibacter fermentans TaxID=2576756 RepID=A0A6N8I0P2_9FIRM|nr:histidine kinase [Caproicibacter fermentans]MVB11113.1 hypothetical protein [Caproicibacter fermentans]
MDLELSGGDFLTGENGRPESVSGKEELFQRATIRLTVPLGSFSCDPSLGSRLHTLKSGTPFPDEKAFSMAQEALRGMPQLTVTGAAVSQADPPTVTVTLDYGGESREVEVKL